MEVYITTYKASLITEAAYKEEVEGEVFEHAKINFLNKIEEQKMLRKKEFYRTLTTEGGELEIFNRIENIDTRKLVHEGDPPAFHKDEDCFLLNSNMHNTFIPEHVKKQGKIDEYRAWYKQKEKELQEGKIKAEHFQARLGLMWGVQSIIEINLNNSGVERTLNLTRRDITRHVNSKIEDINKFRKSLDLKGQHILRKFSKISFICNKEEDIKSFKYLDDFNNAIEVNSNEIKKILKEFHEKYKQPLLEALRNYYRIIWDVKDTYNKTLLERIGFKPCRECCPEEKRRGINAYNSIYSNLKAA